MKTIKKFFFQTKFSLGLKLLLLEIRIIWLVSRIFNFFSAFILKFEKKCVSEYDSVLVYYHPKQLFPHHIGPNWPHGLGETIVPSVTLDFYRPGVARAVHTVL